MEFYAIPITENEEKNKWILYRPLLGTAFVGNQAMINLVRKIEQDQPLAEKELEAKAFLDGIGFLKPDPDVPATQGEPFLPAMAVLLLTNQCNLRCIYCYAGAGEAPKKTLTVELGKAVIDSVALNAQKKNLPEFGLSFHGGGEPTQAWRVIKACVQHARAKPLKASISLTSNGIWSDAQTSWILENINGVSISMDGGPETQARQRPARDGRNSFEYSMRTIRRLDARNFSYGIRMTATAPWSNIPKDVRFLCENTGVKAMQLEPAFNVGRSGHAQPSQQDTQEFIEAILEAYEIAEQAGRKFFYAGARLGWITDVFCTAPYQALIVNPYGEIVPCYEVTDPNHPLISISRYGRYHDGQLDVDTSARQNLFRLMAERRASCKDCFCYWSCAGNCYTRAFEPGENGHLQRGMLCQISQKLIKQLILRKIAEGDGVWHHQVETGQAAVLSALPVKEG